MWSGMRWSEARRAGSSDPRPPGRLSVTPNEAAEKIVREHVIWAMAAGLVPVPLVDIAAVSVIQLDMMSKLATAHAVKFSIVDARSLLTALVGGGAARLGANLLKLVPGAGSVIGGLSMSVMAGASTYAVGQVAMNEFAAGRNLSDINLDAAKNAYAEAFERGKEYTSDIKEEKESPEVFDKLERLSQLLEQGVLTEDEFKLQKQKLLERI